MFGLAAGKTNAGDDLQPPSGVLGGNSDFYSGLPQEVPGEGRGRGTFVVKKEVFVQVGPTSGNTLI